MTSLIIESARNAGQVIQGLGPIIGAVVAGCIAIVWLSPLGARILDGLGD